ncbi:hypothetical protein BH11PAT4_BH11PAT4_4010 [soil metagenome]
MKHFKMILAALVGCLFATVLLAGCNRTTNSPSNVFLALDATGSNKEKKDDYSAAAHAVISGLPNTSFKGTMVGFGGSNGVTKIYDGNITDPDDLAQSFSDYWKGPSPKGKGTFWAALLDRLSKVTEPTSVMIFTDGEIYDIDACKGLVKQIAANTKIKAVFIGPVIAESQYGDQWRSKIENLFAPLGDRLFVAGVNDRGAQIEAFTEYVKK